MPLRVTSACVALAALAVLLDGFAPPPLPFAPGLHWIDLAAVACMACVVDWRALVSGDEHGTPLDGLLLGALAIGSVQAAANGGRDGSGTWLAELVAGSGLYFAFTRGLRRRPEAIEMLWRSLAAVTALLGLHAVWTATGGLGALARAEALADARWQGQHVQVKALVFLTLAVAGRAFEHRSAPAWRLAALLGAIGTVLHLAGGGIGLGSRALGRLDDPIYFSTLTLTLMLLASVVREAWALARARPGESARWRMLAVATGAIAVGGAFGESRGGEGVRMLAGLGAVVVMTVRALPAAPDVPALEGAPAAMAEEAEAGALERAA